MSDRTIWGLVVAMAAVVMGGTAPFWPLGIAVTEACVADTTHTVEFFEDVGLIDPLVRFYEAVPGLLGLVEQLPCL